MFDKCTSTNGIATAANASRKATLVCVKPPGLITMKSVPSVSRRVDAVDQHAFVIALERLQARTGIRRNLLQLVVNVRQRGASIHRGLACTEQVEVGAVKHEDVHAMRRAGDWASRSCQFERCGLYALLSAVHATKREITLKRVLDNSKLHLAKRMLDRQPPALGPEPAATCAPDVAENSFRKPAPNSDSSVALVAPNLCWANCCERSNTAVNGSATLGSLLRRRAQARPAYPRTAIG